MPPVLKKTVTGYVVKHSCSCGEGLINKISEVDSQDTCPVCNSVFVVPGRELVLQLKKKLAEKKRASEKSKELAREQKQAKKASKLEMKESVTESPAIRLPKLDLASSVNEGQLRSLADTAGEWIGIIGRLSLLIAVLSQLLFFGFVVFLILDNGLSSPENLVRLATLILGSASIWLTYYLLRVQLGMVAAVILIERNTRHGR